MHLTPAHPGTNIFVFTGDIGGQGQGGRGAGRHGREDTGACGRAELEGGDQGRFPVKVGGGGGGLQWKWKQPLGVGLLDGRRFIGRQKGK